MNRIIEIILRVISWEGEWGEWGNGAGIKKHNWALAGVA